MNRLKKLVFVAPDNGAVGRRNVYLNSFNSKFIHREAGGFVKQRDYNVVVDGKNPVISHDYSGTGELEGYTAIVPDDMISYIPEYYCINILWPCRVFLVKDRIDLS